MLSFIYSPIIISVTLYTNKRLHVSQYRWGQQLFYHKTIKKKKTTTTILVFYF
jgi:hypothetical protein